MPTAPSAPRWYSVRCVFGSKGDKGFAYEERLTLWHTDTFDHAIESAETEAASYAAETGSEYLGLAQVCQLGHHLTSGTEVFTLIRDSALPSDEYLDAFFDTGTERQSPQEP